MFIMYYGHSYLIPHLDTVIEDIQSYSEDDYALARRQGLGASDSSIVLGVNLYKTKDQLIVEKKSKHITDEEREVKKKDAVRKGFDLEPLILQKFGELMDTPQPIKPDGMYRIKETPFLTINFDGITIEQNNPVPVECKFVTTYGDKYYKRDNAFKRELGDCTLVRKCRPYTDMVDRIKAKADQIGIPPYYYTQVQQQIYGLNAQYGYLCALHDKGWETVVYMVPRDDECIRAIIIEGSKLWNKINR